MQIIDSTQLIDTEFESLSSSEIGPLQEDELIQIRRKRAARIEEANEDSTPTRTPRQRLGKRTEDVIFFKHIKMNVIQSHNNFVELTNAIGILDTMEADVYSIVEIHWDATCPKFFKMIRQKIKENDTYDKVSFASNMDKTYVTSWKPGGSVIGASGR